MEKLIFGILWYFERGSMSEQKINIDYRTLAREFCVTHGEFSDLRYLMNTLND